MTKIPKIALISSLILLLILLFTDPKGLPSVVLIAPFLLLFVMLLLLISFMVGKYGIGRSKRLRIGLIGSSIPVLLLVLQSLGQLTVRDALAIFVLFGIAYFYIARFGTQTAS